MSDREWWWATPASDYEWLWRKKKNILFETIEKLVFICFLIFYFLRSQIICVVEADKKWLQNYIFINFKRQLSRAERITVTCHWIFCSSLLVFLLYILYAINLKLVNNNLSNFTRYISYFEKENKLSKCKTNFSTNTLIC